MGYAYLRRTSTTSYVYFTFPGLGLYGAGLKYNDLTNWQKFQFIQIINQSGLCVQQVKQNDAKIWEKIWTSTCSSKYTNNKYVWITGNAGTSQIPDGRIRNFKFFTHKS